MSKKDKNRAEDLKKTLTEEQKRFIELVGKGEININNISSTAGKSKLNIAKQIAEENGLDYVDKRGLFTEKKPYKKVIEFKKKENNIQFTLDQVEDILEDLYFEDIPFDSNMSVEDKLEVFNHMPQLLQGDCIKWGCNDTEVRTEISKWMLETQLGMTHEEWHDSDKSKQYFDNGHEDNIEIDFKKFYV